MRDLIKYTLMPLLLLTLLCGCEESTDENYEQMEDIVDFLESTHSPNLIAESEVASALDDDPEFYTTYGTYSFRYISTYYDAGRDALAEVVKGSTVTLWFDLYEFSLSAIDEATDLPLYSNRLSDQVKLEEAGLNTLLWDFTPLEIKVGSGEVLDAIDANLVGCREGDEVYIYMTYNMAYKDKLWGLASKEAMVRFSCTIESVQN